LVHFPVEEEKVSICDPETGKGETKDFTCGRGAKRGKSARPLFCSREEGGNRRKRHECRGMRKRGFVVGPENRRHPDLANRGGETFSWDEMILGLRDDNAIKETGKAK